MNKKPNHQRKSANWLMAGNIVIRVIQSLLLFLVVLVLLGGSLGLGIGTGYFAYLVQDTEPPSKEQLEKEINDIEEVSHLAYANDKNFATIRSDIVRTTVASDKMSPLLKKAIISTEDEYFEEHNGVVPKALIRALISDITGLGGSSGGSTLTQQLVKQQILTDETTFKRKANEILMAMRVDKYFSKDEIITTYLNVSPFGRNNLGQNIAGVQEAAQGIFGKNADDLTLPQAAFIAGLPQSPIVYSPYTNTGEVKDDENLQYGLDRKDFVLFSMYREKAISKEEYDEAIKYDLKKDFLKQGKASANENGFLYDTVLHEAILVLMTQDLKKDDLSLAEAQKDGNEDLYNRYYDQAERRLRRNGYTVHSTINEKVYNAMQEAVKKNGYLLDYDNPSNDVQTGNILIDNKTGAVLGFVGGRDYQASQVNNAFYSKRQPGSTIKPIMTYAPAIDQGLIGSASRLPNFPMKIPGTDENLQNSTQVQPNTFVDVRTALEWSFNQTVVSLNEAMKNETGDDLFSYNHYLSKMGIPKDDSWGYWAAPMGTTEMTVLKQANTFQTLANQGKYVEAHLIDKITDNHGNIIYEFKPKETQVFSKATASIMNDLLRSVLDSGNTTQVLDSLSGSAANADWVGKTGTTNEYHDSWLTMSTPKVTLSAWTGYDQNQNLTENSSQYTGMYMAALVNAINNADGKVLGTDQRFKLSGDVKKETVSEFTGEQAGTVDYNGRTIKIPGGTTTSYYAEGGPRSPAFKFGIAGTDSNYDSYWKKYTAAPAPKPSTNNNNSNSNSSNSNNSDKKDEDKKDEDKKDDDKKQDDKKDD